MAYGIRKLKPGVARRVHVFSAAFLWSFIGCLLLYRGYSLLSHGGSLWFLLLGWLAGTAKSVFVLDRAARQGLERIRHFSDNTCIGAVYSWKTWLLAIAMMVFGFSLRSLSLPPNLIGTLCIAIGWALLFSSRHAWKTWIHWKSK